MNTDYITILLVTLCCYVIIKTIKGYDLLHRFPELLYMKKWDIYFRIARFNAVLWEL